MIELSLWTLLVRCTCTSIPACISKSCAREQGKLGNARLVATVKEVAPTSMAKNDEELGVGEFASKYFANGEVFLDENQDFYKALGSRSITSVKLKSWNPIKIFKEFRDMSKRMDAKGISGNLAGDARLLGAVLIVNKGSLLRFQANAMCSVWREPIVSP